MKRHFGFVLALFGLCVLAFSSCKDENDLEKNPSDYISFKVVESGGDDGSVRSGYYVSCPSDSVRLLAPLVSESGDSLAFSVTESSEFVSNDRWGGSVVGTRGSLATLSSSTEFGVSASVYSSSSSYSSNGLGNYFYCQKFTAGGGSTYLWPDDSRKISFHGYYPYGNGLFTMSSASSVTGYPVYSYTVPSDISKQVDILTTSVVDHACGSQSAVTLPFKHNCSSLRFVLKNTTASSLTVKSISIEGVKYSGTLQNGAWTLSSSVNSSSSNPFKLDLNKTVVSGATDDLTGTSGIFIMLPQTLSSNAKCIIECSDKTYSTTLSGEWVAGKTYTYNISFEADWTFSLDVVGTSEYSYTGGSNTYKVTSYKTYGGSNVAAAWTASFSTDGGATWSSTRPSWLSSFTASGNGGTTASSYTAKVAEAEGTLVSSESATDILKAASAVSNYDLSTHTVSGASCSMTTANCYMVHAPGTYKLPLVYGNAIKNGATNSEAYNPTGKSGTYFLKPFVNHADAGITDPWLKNNGATPDGAKLIWQDSNGLISAVGISGDYLTFTVSSANIAEGNAVIAATQGGTVVWSWHIWVTPETLSTLTSIEGDSYTYKVTHVNLGWVGSGNATTTDYSGRSCLVKITQSDSGLSKTFSVVQNGGDGIVESSKQGVNTYYQFGRKDPEIPAVDYKTNSNHAAYDISGSSVSPTYSQSSVAIGTTIQNPLIHYYSSSTDCPYSTYQYNLWDANNTTTGWIMTKTVKTIYDPCPPGFCIPTSNLWYVMTGGGRSTTGTWDSTSLGRLWTSNTPNVYFPASGLRDSSDGSLGSVGSDGYCWSASPNSSSYGHYLYLDSSYWYWNYDNRSYGFPVRAVLEE